VASYASARLYQHHTTLDELKKLIATLSTNVTTLAIDVSTIKADQARLHVTINKVQLDVVGDGLVSSGKSKGANGDAPGGPTPTTSHKLRFPKYNGTVEPLVWLHRYDQFFWVARMPKEEKVWYTAFYLDGDTL
jgi:hypothetical protein